MPKRLRTPGPKAWAMFVDLMRAWLRRKGHALVPSRARVGNFHFGQMVCHRRREYREGFLTPEQVRICESFRGWTWDPNDARFHRNVLAARRFYERHGHLRVPPTHRPGGVALKSWLEGCRAACRRGSLSSDRVRLLESIPGFQPDPHDARFARGLRFLERFIRREAHARVEQQHVERGFPLGIWVAGLRTRYRLGQLPRRFHRRLERLRGWTWSPAQDVWEDLVGHLRRFVRRHGHARVPHHHQEARGRYPLGIRVWSLRISYRAGRLSGAKIRALEGLPGWAWNARRWVFDDGVRRIREYARRAPVAAVPHRYQDPRTGYRLGRRVYRLREAYWKGRLTKAQIRVLEGIKGWSWGRRPG